jgi:hypothetical protein
MPIPWGKVNHSARCTLWKNVARRVHYMFLGAKVVQRSQCLLELCSIPRIIASEEPVWGLCHTALTNLILHLPPAQPVSVQRAGAAVCGKWRQSHPITTPIWTNASFAVTVAKTLPILSCGQSSRLLILSRRNSSLARSSNRC